MEDYFKNIKNEFHTNQGPNPTVYETDKAKNYTLKKVSCKAFKTD